MPWTKWILIVLAVFEAGWVTFDGARALIVGDYVTPQTGPHAGQLGSWSILVTAIGIEPRSAVMKAIFVGYGASWLLTVGAFILKASWAWWGMLVAAVGSLWYLLVGTLISVIQVILLLLPAVRSSS
jgi:hypothetical protein